MSLARLEFQIPLCHFLADIFFLPFLKDLVTDILRLGALPVQSLGIALQISFRLLQQSLEIHPAGAKTNFRPVAKHIANLRALPGGLHRNIFQPAQLPSDARQFVLQLLDVVFVEIDRLAQHLHRPRELMAIFKNGRQFMGPADAERASGCLLGEPLVDGEIVKFIRQRESFRSRREPGAGFIFLQRVQRQDRVLTLRVLLLPWPPPPIRQRVLAKLRLVKLGKFQFRLGCEIPLVLRQLGQQPAPALTIAGSRFPGGGQVMVNRLALFIHRRAPRPIILMAEIVAVAVEKLPISGSIVIIRQLRQVGQRLQFPAFNTSDNGGELAEEVCSSTRRSIRRQRQQGLLHQLQCAGPIPAFGGDVLGAVVFSAEIFS